ncbi:hypothetical protein Tsubulata_031431, partial [Turnera subulata]
HQQQTRDSQNVVSHQNPEAAQLGDLEEGVAVRSSWNGQNDVFITWEDIGVTVSNRKQGAMPDQETYWQSWVLLVVARLLFLMHWLSGEVLINGRKPSQASRTSAYVTQDDVITWTLTVREAVYYSAQLQLPNSMPLIEKKERAETTIKQMGLHHAIDTRIGGCGKKGISGGEKRRVSICIEILTRPKLLFLDEPTSGLDSAASYYIMKQIVSLAKQEGMTIIASIHQPGSEVFQLFHNLCLLSSGRTIYFGPSKLADNFFEMNGFPCPSHQNPSDHYLRTINTDFDEVMEPGFAAIKTTEVISLLGSSYQSSDIFQQIKGQVADICMQDRGEPKRRTQASFINQCLILTRRSFVNMYRDLGYYWLRLAIYIALSLGLGTVFYAVGGGHDSIQARGSFLMFVASFLTIMAIGGFPSFMEEMKRERLNGHYVSGAFIVGNTFSSAPYLLVISLIPGAIAYTLAGLQPRFTHFIYFALTLYACMLLVESLMMIVASFMPNFLMGLITGLTFPSDRGGVPYNSGEEILRKIWQVEMGYSKWVDLGILFAMQPNVTALSYQPPSSNKSRETQDAVEMETVHQIPSRYKKSGDTSTDDGVYMTWEDLWVTVSNGRKGTKSILHGLTGYARPGELLAIMGPSGCGKSTLLDTLAGRLNPNTRQTGDILINGQKQTLAYGTSAYVTQDDTLIATLTVKESVYYSAQLQLPDSMSKAEKKDRAEVTIREMGLQDAMNTRIGGWGAKGLSGGQKRRLSICIEILTRPKLLFLDEPTSGLDSAASYYVMKRIAAVDQKDGIRRTIIASIHQPSSEVFQLFNSLCLLSSGKVVYFGPASAANEFFALNGFPCPTLQNPSDHYLKTINKDFDKDIEQGLECGITAEEATATLISSYKKSDHYQQVQRQVAEVAKLGGGTLEKKRSHSSFITQSLVLTRRSFLNMFRDLGYYWLRLAIYVTLAIGLATMYHNLGSDYDSIKDRGSLLVFIASFLTFMTIGGFPSFVEDMKVFERERLNGHYGTVAFVVANTFSAMPYLILTSLISGAITYYYPGLQRGSEHFLYFVLVLLACLMLVESLMMIVASFVPNYLMGIITGAGIQGLMILGGGFFRLPNDLPKPFWKYPMYYIAFHKYAYQGLFKNEFQGLTFFTDNQAGHVSRISGEVILRDMWQVEMNVSKWVDLAVLSGMILLYRVLFLVIVKGKEKMKPMISALLSVPPKKSAQVMINPAATPLHGENQ